MNTTIGILKYIIPNFFAFSLINSVAFAQDSTHKQETPPVVNISYGDRGFEFQASDQKYLLQIQSRLQFRYAFPADQNPLTLDDFEEENRHIFKINRTRLKVGGMGSNLG